MSNSGFPRFKQVADFAILVEFADNINEPANEAVVILDAALTQNPFTGFLEAVPAYVSLLVSFDPILTDFESAKSELLKLIKTVATVQSTSRTHEIPVCYDDEFALDLAGVVETKSLDEQSVIQLHCSAEYKVIMYGFAPGYAYLSGTPQALYLPRKSAAVCDVPAGSVIIAGNQCLITTLTMPTGWWVIGRSPTRILTGNEEKPFLFDVADKVVFKPVSRMQFHEIAGQK